MVNEDEEIVKIEEVNKKLFSDINFIKKIGLMLTKIGITSIGYTSSFTLASVVLNEEINNFQNIGLTTLSILNFIAATLVVRNIKNKRKKEKNKTINYESIDISDIYKSNKNILLLSFLFAATGLSMYGMIDICKLEEIKHMLISNFGVTSFSSLITFFYGSCYIGNIDDYLEKVYKKSYNS